MLVVLAHAGAPAAFIAGAIGAALLFGIWRRRAADVAPLLLTRDTAFLACAMLTIAFIAFPARWSFGAAIAAALFGLILHALSLLSPAEHPA